jgi:hypothetical protein
MRSADERRGARRQTYARGHLPPAARIRPGTPVIVCNLSRTGALVEARLRCKPGARCDFVMATDDGEIVIRARVVRCFVARLTAATVRYRTALSFEHPAIPPPSLVMATGYEVPLQPSPTTQAREETSRPVRRSQ